MAFIATSTEGFAWIISSHLEEEADGGMKSETSDEKMRGNGDPCRKDSVTASSISKTFTLLLTTFLKLCLGQNLSDSLNVNLCFLFFYFFTFSGKN